MLLGELLEAPGIPLGLVPYGAQGHEGDLLLRVVRLRSRPQHCGLERTVHQQALRIPLQAVTDAP